MPDAAGRVRQFLHACGRARCAALCSLSWSGFHDTPDGGTGGREDGPARPGKPVRAMTRSARAARAKRTRASTRAFAIRASDARSSEKLVNANPKHREPDLIEHGNRLDAGSEDALSLRGAGKIRP